jgi:opacity protein-like surface antigen
MKIQHRLWAFLAVLAVSGSAWANEFYIRADFAYSWVWDDQTTVASSTYSLSPDPVPLGQLGFGYNLDPYVRFDVTGALTGTRAVYADPAAAGGFDVDTSTLFVNGYYELSTLWTKEPTRWRPYIGLGLGSAYQYMSDVHTSLLSIDSKGQWQFAWRGMAGLGVLLTDNLFFDMSYVYMGAGQAESGTGAMLADGTAVRLAKPLSMDMNAQEVYIGLRQQF